MILAGGGVILSNASSAVTEMAESLHIPVTCSLMGIGCFPAKDPLWLGMCGMHGAYAANMALNNADLIICVGARFDDRVTGKLSGFAPHARDVHIDSDPTSIRKNVRVDVPVVGDCRLAVEGINEISRNKFSGQDMASRHAQWIETIGEWKREQPLTYAKGDKYLKPQHVVRVLNEITMGYGFPAAIGAQVAFPNKLVIDIAGDGSIQMNIQEMATAVQNKLPVKIVILNNTYLGMVRQWQELFYKHNYSSTSMTGQPDFVKLAEAYGAEGYRIMTEEELAPTLKKALASPNTAIIDVVVEPEEDVYPMVPAGASLDEMLLV